MTATDAIHDCDRRDSTALRVLLVDDNPMNLLVAKAHLTRMGHDVATAQDGLGAVELFQGGRFDAVLMDIQMPRMNGYDASRHIREVLGDRDVPIIALSAGAAGANRSAALESGMNEFVAKPVDWAHLGALLTGLIGRRSVAP